MTKLSSLVILASFIFAPTAWAGSDGTCNNYHDIKLAKYKITIKFEKIPGHDGHNIVAKKDGLFGKTVPVTPAGVAFYGNCADSNNLIDDVE